MAGWADVVAAGTALPEVVESTSYGTPCLKVRKALMCRLKEDGGTLAIRVVDEQDKHALIQADPAVFSTTPHYDGYAYVLVALESVRPEQLQELLEDAWRLRAPKRLVARRDAG